MPELKTLGWGDDRAAEFGPHAARGLRPTRVCLEHNHLYRVLMEEGEFLAEAAGRIKHEASGRRELPAVGDWVAVRMEPAATRVTIRALLTRRTWFSRRAAGRATEEQVIAANVDVVLLVFALDIHVKPRAIERYVALAARSGARSVVILNKADLSDDPEAAAEEARAVAGGSPVHVVSAKTGVGVDALQAYLSPGVTLALLGPSGAGKSSLVNRLVGEERQVTGEVREWDARGRHTSVHRQLLLCERGGLLIDTPGMRELQLWDREDTLEEAFPDIAALAAGCRFRDCRHEQEPGCAVKDAVGAGQLSEDRHAAYLTLAAERQATTEARVERARADEKRQSKIQTRALRKMQKDRDQ